MSATSESNSWWQGGSEGRATRPRWRHRAAGRGSELNLGDASRAAPRAMVLGLAGFLIASGTVAIASMAAADAGWLPAGWSWLHGITLGAILGGSSSIVIMPAVRRMGLSPTLSNLVSLESALTDVLCVVIAAASIRVAVTGSTDLAAAAATLGRAFGIGLGGGLVVGLLALLALKQLRRSTHAYPLLLGMLLVTYVALDELGGSAALGILVVAVLVDNAPALANAVGLVRSAKLGQDVVHTHDQLAFFVKSFFFTFMGAMLGPSGPDSACCSWPRGSRTCDTRARSTDPGRAATA